MASDVNGNSATEVVDFAARLDDIVFVDLIDTLKSAVFCTSLTIFEICLHTEPANGLSESKFVL